MTIEAKIEELTAAIWTLAKVYEERFPLLKDKPDELTPEAKPEEPKKKKAEAKAKENPAPEPENVEVETKVIEYATVRDKVLALIKADPNNRDKILDVLSEFGAETAKQLKPEQYAEALEKLNEIEA